MLLILVEVSLKVFTTATESYHHATICEVACQSTNCSHRATSVVLYSGGSICESCLSVPTTDCSHSANSMLLILVEVSVKVAYRSTTAAELTPCYLFWWKYLWKWLVGPQQPQTAAIELPPCYLLWWKYLWKWLVGPWRHRLLSIRRI